MVSVNVIVRVWIRVRLKVLLTRLTLGVFPAFDGQLYVSRYPKASRDGKRYVEWPKPVYTAR